MLLTPEEKRDIAFALDMWSNWIQTDNPLTSAVDAKNAGKKAKTITVEQMRFIAKLADLRDKVLANKWKRWYDDSDPQEALAEVMDDDD